MPASLMMEAVMQTGVFTVTTTTSIEDGLMMFQSCKLLEVYAAVRPGEILQTQVHLTSYRHGVANLVGQAWNGSTCVCAMTFALVAPKEIEKYSKQTVIS